MIGGDFNLVVFPHERIGIGTDIACMREFWHCLRHLLPDWLVVGWWGVYLVQGRGEAILSRIDRFLVSTTWEETTIQLC